MRILQGWVMAFTLVAMGCGAADSGASDQREAFKRYVVKFAACSPDEIGIADPLYPLVVYPRLGRIDAFMEKVLACADDAQDCDRLSECRYGGDVAGSCEPQKEGHSYCDGNSLVQCERAFDETYEWFRLDCSLTTNVSGATCVEANSDARCGFPSDCAEIPIDGECDSDVVVTCSGGVMKRLDCAEMGLKCVQGQTGEHSPEVSCAPAGLTCVFGGEGGSGCAGDSLYHCYDQGVAQFGIPCSWLFPGTTCLTGETETGVEVAFCGKAGDPVPNASMMGSESCDGSMAKLCAGKQCLSFDCSAFMNGTCKEVPGSEMGMVDCVSPLGRD